VIACHDEIVVECDAGEAEAVAAWLRQAMVDGMAPLIEPVTVVVEVSVGRSWAGRRPEPQVPLLLRVERLSRAGGTRCGMSLRRSSNGMASGAPGPGAPRKSVPVRPR
jgi:hypothetical protein